MAGSWKRTITSPFRKACTILSPQHPQQAGGGGDKHATTRAGRRRHGAHLKGSSSSSPVAAMEYGGEAVDTRGPGTTELYGDVMACGYEDVQVMWSMLDNKARVDLL